jgi:hypothetical protein
MKTIKAYFIFCIQDDQHSTGKPKAKASNVYERVYFIAHQVAPGYCPKISEHVFHLFGS